MIKAKMIEQFGDYILEYIRDNFEPEDVFTRDQLQDCARNEFSFDEIFDVHTALEEVSNLDPEDVFSIEQLECWAESVGYVIPNDEYDYYEDR